MCAIMIVLESAVIAVGSVVATKTVPTKTLRLGNLRVHCFPPRVSV